MFELQGSDQIFMQKFEVTLATNVCFLNFFLKANLL